PRAAVATIVLLALFATWTGLSALWSDNAERVASELDRTALYLGVLTAAALLVSRGALPMLLDGTAIGLVATAALALPSRFLPAGASPGPEVAAALPASLVRLSYPVVYWNGLGVLVGLAAPLLLRSAVGARSRIARALAVGALPLIATTIDLTASRGA